MIVFEIINQVLSSLLAPLLLRGHIRKVARVDVAERACLGSERLAALPFLRMPWRVR